MKPSISFLRKVEAGAVRRVLAYSAKRGGYHKFYGGEASARAHQKAGFITMKGFAELGRPAIATLTDAGRAALEAAPTRALKTTTAESPSDSKPKT